jgi:Phage integrase family/Putative transposase
VHLTVERQLSPNSLTGYCSGLRFFYNETLGWDENKLFIPPRKKPSVLPEVFSPDEVVGLIGAARGLKQRVLLMTAYSAGLRVSELVNLKITDIDAARMTLRVKRGKGGKDRYAILSQKLLTELRQYWKRYRPAIWLFPNRAKNGPLSRGEAWHIFRSAKKRAGNREVTFSYRDRKDQNRKKTMTLDAHEFIRRFLLHVIPKGFVRVRHFGFLANQSKGLLAKCRQLLTLNPALPKLPSKSVHELMLQLTGVDISRCPLCQKGTLVFFANLPVPAPWDSS